MTDKLDTSLPGVEAPRKKGPPRNKIVPEKIVSKWDSQIDGLVIDTDILLAEQELHKTRAKNFAATIQAEVKLNGAAIKSLSRWNFIRDLIVIVLLLAAVGLVIWRGMLVEHRMEQCARLDSIAVMAPPNG